MAVGLIITGAAGRMGQVLLRLAAGSPDFALLGSTEREGVAVVGPVFRSFATALAAKPAVVIDFTSPTASAQHAAACAEAGVALVIGSTGFDEASQAAVGAAAKRVPIVQAPNMSVGVNVILSVAAQLAAKLGEDFDIEVLEAHHKHKKDAPSGTALKLAEVLATATGRTHADFRTTRDGVIGERPKNEIGLQTLRGGDVVGEHTVFFFGEGERVELTHRATSRDQFGKGALRAARWVVGKPSGLYAMTDVLAGELGGAAVRV
jgi:4-hydroxy-tetrahydrodipicolinate reductase